MYYLLLKTHNKTGLKYLCQTKKKDPIKYPGSGTRWLRHLNKHGFNFTTKILGKFSKKKDLVQAGEKYSIKWNVKKDRGYANLIDEKGDGGDTSDFINYKKMKPMPTGLWKRPDLTKYNQIRINPNKGKKLSYHTRKKMSKAQKGRKMSEETKQKLSKSRTGLKLSDQARVSSSKYTFTVKGVKKNLVQISEDTNLSYSLLVQRVEKNNKITYRQLIKPSLKDKFIFNKKEYSAKEFSEYLNINIKTYYRWKERSLTPEEMYKQKQSGKNLM